MEFRNDQHKREVKRKLKRDGKKARRRALKQSLEDNPDEADLDIYRFNDFESSKELNDSPYND